MQGMNMICLASSQQTPEMLLVQVRPAYNFVRVTHKGLWCQRSPLKPLYAQRAYIIGSAFIAELLSLWCSGVERERGDRGDQHGGSGGAGGGAAAGQRI